MSSMHLYIQTTGQNLYPGSRIAQDQYVRYLGRFAKFMADEMVKELVKAIDTQRYKSRWVPLSVDYYEYKKRMGLSLNIWEATSLLKNSITVYRSGNRWVVGISKSKTYPGTQVKVWKIAQAMEFGTSRMPARPLFRPIVRYMRRNVRRYWIEFMRKEGLI